MQFDGFGNVLLRLCPGLSLRDASPESAGTVTMYQPSSSCSIAILKSMPAPRDFPIDESDYWREESGSRLFLHLLDLFTDFIKIVTEPLLALFCVIAFSVIKHLDEPDQVDGSECF
jgi:hypothetical protein